MSESKFYTIDQLEKILEDDLKKNNNATDMLASHFIEILKGGEENERT